MEKGTIVEWEYEGHTAVGILGDDPDWVDIAYNYRRDSNITSADQPWFADEIYIDKGSHLREASYENLAFFARKLADRIMKY